MFLVLLACSTPHRFPTTTGPTSEPAATAPTQDLCDEVRTPLAVDEVGPQGLTPNEMLGDLVGLYEAPFDYRDGTETLLSMELTLIGAERVEQVPRPTTAQTSGTASCEGPTVALTLETELWMDDGAIGLEFLTEVHAQEALADLSLFPYVDVDALAGTFLGTDMVQLSVVAHLQPGGLSSGELIEIRSDGSECGIGAWNQELMTGCP